MSARGAVGGRGLCVALDLRHPFSYLALAPSFAFAAQLELEVDWLPIRAQALRAPSAPGPADDRGIRHRRARAEMIAREIAVYAGVQGLAIESPYRDGPADAFHFAWLWVREREPLRLRALLEQAFRRYWAVALDPESPGDVARLLGALDFDLSRFREWARADGPAALDAARSALAGAGVDQAPAYVLGGEVFYGRQHLPMLRWILQGRSGERPI